MRLRNIPRADDTLQAHFTVIKNPKEFRGNWTSVFGNDRPIRIEIGMGKGRFLLNMAKTYPNINFIGIERYSSVLLRAVEKFDTEEFSDLPNIRFVCMDARELPEVFAESEVDRIYLNFPTHGQNHVMQNAVLHQQSFYPVMKKSSHRKDLWSSKRTTPLFLTFLWNR